MNYDKERDSLLEIRNKLEDIEDCLDQRDPTLLVCRATEAVKMSIHFVSDEIDGLPKV